MFVSIIVLDINHLKFVIIIFTRACRVLQKMLSNSRKGGFSFKASDWLARAGHCALVLRNMLLENSFGHMLLNFLL